MANPNDTRNFPHLESFETGYLDGKLGEICDTTRATIRYGKAYRFSFRCESIYIDGYTCGALERAAILATTP